MSNRKALVLGTNAGQADLIRYLKAAGWDVIACGYKAVGPGVDLADRFEPVDITDVEGVADLARREEVDLVYSVSSDLAVPTVVEVSERLGLPRFFDADLLETMIDKAKLRERLNGAGLSPVEFRVVCDTTGAEGWTSFPCIVKPISSQGQRGVSFVERETYLIPAISTALDNSKSGKAIIEEYLDGIEVSANVLVSRGRVVVNEISERLVHGPPLTGIPRGHLILPLHADETAVDDAAELVERIIRELGVTDGLLYFQMKLTSGGARVVEIAPRLDGCHIWRLIKIARGFDLIDLTVRCLLGEDVALPEVQTLGSKRHELMFQQMAPGLPFSSQKFPVPDDALYHEYRYEEGEIVQPINGLMEVVGYYVRQSG